MPTRCVNSRSLSLSLVLLIERGRNYTMKVMPTPVNDAAVALRINQTKTEQALRKVLKTMFVICMLLF